MTTNIIIAGIIGGILPDVIRIVNTKDQPPPKFFWSAYFLLGLVLQIGLGVLACWLTQSEDFKQAIFIGYAGPNIITSFAGKYEKTQSGDKGAEAAGLSNLRTWWRN